MKSCLSDSSDEDSGRFTSSDKSNTFKMEGKKRCLSDSSDEDSASPTSSPLKRIKESSDISERDSHGLNPRSLFSTSNSKLSMQNDLKRKLSQSTSDSDDDEAKQERCFNSSFQNRMDTLIKPAKKAKFENTKIQRMLDRMGHQEGKGLGKYDQGRVEPVELSTQRGRQGLGFSVEGLEAASLNWDFSKEVIEVEETVTWLEERHHTTLEKELLRSWIRQGPIKLIIDDETEFCDPDILHNVLNSKNVFDRLPSGEMRKARMRCNPFETIRGGIFLNRAAMKMANMDAVFDFMFTSPVDESNQSLVKESPLYFADVCAGPGGFSEYVLWRKQWEAKGFGFTLKGENDFRLSDFLAGPCESFETHYGVGGMDGDGDVCNPDNIRAFTDYVYERTYNSGVHFMMADGGFSVESKENIQEILSKQLYLCQFLVALSIVRTSGHFVCKVFDLFTPFSVGLIYLLYKSFKKISIHKPNSSRPANSERYVICKWKREDCAAIRDYLFYVNERYIKLRKEDLDVVEVVPLDVIKEDSNFMEYIIESNDSLGDRQVVNLVKIAAFCKDTALEEVRQSELKTACLNYWKVPDNPRKVPSNNNPHEKAIELLGSNIEWMTHPEKSLTETTLKELVTSAYDWRCFVVSSTEKDPKLTFYLGLGQGKVFSLQPGNKGKIKWNQVTELKVELSPGTLILGETLQEHQGEGRSQQRVRALHIVDAFFLGGKDLRNIHLKERNAMCIKFAESMNKPLRKDLATIRVKSLVRLVTLRDIFQRLEKKMMKSSNGIERLAYNLESENKYIIPSGIMFIRETKDPWVKTIKGDAFCWFNASVGQIKKDFPKDSIADLKCCFEKRLMWRWAERDLRKIENLNINESESHNGLNGLSDTLLTSQLRDHINLVRLPFPPNKHSGSSSHRMGHAGFGHSRH